MVRLLMKESDLGDQANAVKLVRVVESCICSRKCYSTVLRKAR